jgi:hypothetical protein
MNGLVDPGRKPGKLHRLTKKQRKPRGNGKSKEQKKNKKRKNKNKRDERKSKKQKNTKRKKEKKTLFLAEKKRKVDILTARRRNHENAALFFSFPGNARPWCR